MFSLGVCVQMPLFLQGRRIIGLGATLIQDDLILTSITSVETLSPPKVTVTGTGC